MSGVNLDDSITPEPALQEDDELKGRSPRELAWRRFRRNKVGIAAAIFTLGTLLSSLFAPLICKALGLSATELHLEAINVSTGLPKAYLGGISWEHPLGLLPGTGRDLLAQLLYGSRISFLVMILATVATLFVGLLAGIAGGYLKGRVDATLGRLTDFLLAFPAFFMIVALAEPLVDRIQRLGIAHGNSARILFLIIILTFFGWTGFSRLIRSQVLSLSERDFVTAATALGASRSRIIFQELIPNLWAPVIVVLSLSLPGYLTAESVFSFLGIGVQPPGFTWGLLISNSTNYVTNMPSFFLIATVSLVLVVLAFNLLGDAVRDALDPKADK